jgi:hypothetical protein
MTSLSLGSGGLKFSRRNGTSSENYYWRMPNGVTGNFSYKKLPTDILAGFDLTIRSRVARFFVVQCTKTVKIFQMATIYTKLP